MRRVTSLGAAAAAAVARGGGPLTTLKTGAGASVRKIGVVGDGNLSFSASLAELLKGSGVNVVGTTLDSKNDLIQYFTKGQESIDRIEAAGHRAAYGVDATCPSSLGHALGPESCERLIWNFPHYPGKQNIKRNRALLRDFFECSSKVLSPGGEICLNLAEGQGGTHADPSEVKWAESWQITVQAAEGGFKLSDVRVWDDMDEFEEIGYTRSGHRGRDRTFPVGTPRLHTFLHSSTPAVKALAHPLWRHELHLRSPAPLSPDSVDRAVRSAAGPDNIARVQLSSTHICRDGVPSSGWEILYGSQWHPFGRSRADELRLKIEASVPDMLGCELRGGRRSCGSIERAPVASWLLE